MNYFKKFQDDLERSGIYEIYIKKVFEEKGFEFVEYCNNKYFDILMLDKNKKDVMIEVKSDSKTAYTPNIIFEFESYGKPSGVKTSTSDYWVYVFPPLKEIWFIKTNALKKIIKTYNPEILPESYDTWTWVYGGDGKNTKCYLWDRKIFSDIMGKDLRILKRYDIP